MLNYQRVIKSFSSSVTSLSPRANVKIAFLPLISHGRMDTLLLLTPVAGIPFLPVQRDEVRLMTSSSNFLSRWRFKRRHVVKNESVFTLKQSLNGMCNGMGSACVKLCISLDYRQCQQQGPEEHGALHRSKWRGSLHLVVWDISLCSASALPEDNFLCARQVYL